MTNPSTLADPLCSVLCGSKLKESGYFVANGTMIAKIRQISAGIRRQRLGMNFTKRAPNFNALYRFQVKASMAASSNTVMFSCCALLSLLPASAPATT